MTRAIYLIFFGLTLLSGSLFYLILRAIDPEALDWVGLGSVYLLLLLGGMSFFSFLKLILQRLPSKKTLIRPFLKTTLRQSFFLSLILVGFLVLNQLDFLFWWSGGFLTLLIIFLEFFYAKKSSKN